MTLKDSNMSHQVIIPDNLSEQRYISGMYALNLPAPEDTSGDWHFLSVFYRKSITPHTVMIAGEGEKINTNHIFGKDGIYVCDKALARRGLKADGKTSYAANHFRAILDLVHSSLQDNIYPSRLSGASEDYLDTDDEKNILLEKATAMLPHLSSNASEMLQKWIEEERKPGYRS